MSETIYRLTVRPAWAEHVPPGYTSLKAADTPGPGDYGTVTYPEPLDHATADHYSLRPVGPPLPTVTWDGKTYPLLSLLGTLNEAAWDYQTGQLTGPALAALIDQTFDEHGIASTEYEITFQRADRQTP